MIRPSWKMTLVGAFVAVILTAAVSQAVAGCGGAWWGCGPVCSYGCGYGGCGYGGCGWGGCCSVVGCGSSCYSSCCGGDCWSGCRAYRRCGACRGYAGCCGWPCGGYSGCSTCMTTSSCCGATEYPVYAAPGSPVLEPSMPMTPTPAAKPAAPTPATPSAAPATPAAPSAAPITPPTPTTSQEPTQETSGLLTIWVPAEAKVTINGLATRSTGSKRQYVSFGLKPGFSYKYEVRAEIVREGQRVEEARTISLTAGQRSAVAFGFNKPAESLVAN